MGCELRTVVTDNHEGLPYLSTRAVSSRATRPPDNDTEGCSDSVLGRRVGYG